MRKLIFFALTLLLCWPALVQTRAQTSASEKQFIESIESELKTPVPEKRPKVKKQVVVQKRQETKDKKISDALPQYKEGERPYGHYKLRIGMMKPKFNGDVNFYEELYGNARWYPNLMLDWIPWAGPVGIGLGFRMGYYSDRGKAVRSTPVSGQPLDIDNNQETRLRLYPLQLVMAFQYSPFSRKWVGIDAWVGYEHLFYTETRLSSVDDVDSSDLFVNEGHNKSIIYGASIDILLNALDWHSAAVLNRSIGIGYMYLTYVFEVSNKFNDGKAVDLSRMTQGITLSFETTL